MNRHYRFLPQAERDFADQYDYLEANAPPDGAERYRAALDATCNSLAQHSGLGKRVRTARRNLRGLRQFLVSSSFDKYIIFYIGTESGIDVARILYGSRDIDSILALG